VSRRKLKTPKAPADRPKPRAQPPTAWEVINPHAAGIDVHSDNHVVCVGRGSEDLRTFGAYTADLHALVEYLRQAGVTTVALESTGVYWIPLFELLEREGFAVYLIEPGQLKSLGSRPKTDVHDCQWLQRLHAYGLLKGSFRPPETVEALRAYHRQRLTHIRHCARAIQHMQKALEQMNVKLTEVLSDIAGLTGLLIIRAIIEGERDGQKLARLRDRHCAKSEAEIALALQGTWAEEHLFSLRQAVEAYDFYQGQKKACEKVIEAELTKQVSRSDGKTLALKPPGRGRKRNDLSFEAKTLLFNALGVDLTAIEGIEVATALVILSEIGVDVSKFPTEKHFACWLGLAPRTDRSNRTERRRSPRKGKNRVAQALRHCAQAIAKTQTPLAVFYRRIKSRIGGKGACTATAHKLARLVYRMMKHGTEYVVRGMAEYAAKLHEQQERSLRRKARLLGFELVAKTPSEAEALGVEAT
jgi:transposase